MRDIIIIRNIVLLFALHVLYRIPVSLRMARVRPDAYKLIFGAPKVLFTAHYIPLCVCDE